MRAEITAEKRAEELDGPARDLHVLRAEGGVAKGFDDNRGKGGDGSIWDRATNADEEEHVGFRVLVGRGQGAGRKI